MSKGFGQFCPVAKATEIFATRWTPLLLRELLEGGASFNDIHRGVPLMSRTLLADRLRDLEREGIVEKRRLSRRQIEYWLTPAGDAFKDVIYGLGRWGFMYARDRIQPKEMDPGLYLWMLRRRLLRADLPERRAVLQFEFSGVPAAHTKLRRMWLVLKRRDVDVCMKDPGHAIDLTLRGDIRAFISVLLGHVKPSTAFGRLIMIEGDSEISRRASSWLVQ